MEVYRMPEKGSFTAGKETFSPPDFVWICGAVGSGNTFLFRCLTQAPDVYGINEDALGNTLDRFIQSGIDMGTCPHGVEAYVDFMYGLRKEKKTLILKTPSNIHFHRIIRKHLPGSKFITTIREPHAAIVSGLSRHRANVERVAGIWLKDSLLIREIGEGTLLVNYDELITSPETILEKMNTEFLQVSSAVFRYAKKHARPGLADPDRWRTRADEKTRREIELWVKNLSLTQLFQELTGDAPYRNVRKKSPTGNFLGELFWIGTHGKKILRRILHRRH